MQRRPCGPPDDTEEKEEEVVGMEELQKIIKSFTDSQRELMTRIEAQDRTMDEIQGSLAQVTLNASRGNKRDALDDLELEDGSQERSAVENKAGLENLASSTAKMLELLMKEMKSQYAELYSDRW